MNCVARLRAGSCDNGTRIWRHTEQTGWQEETLKGPGHSGESQSAPQSVLNGLRFTVEAEVALIVNTWNVRPLSTEVRFP
jgi:hypothetical protein